MRLCRQVPARASIHAPIGLMPLGKYALLARPMILGGCLFAAPATLGAELATESLSGGLFTTSVQDANAFRQTIAFADEKRRLQFLDGFDSLAQKWVMPFLPGGVWGRGPLSNEESCLGCHINSGRGSVPAKSDEPMRTMLTRVSLAGKDRHGAALPHPHYGHQINHLGVQWARSTAKARRISTGSKSS